MAAFPSLGALLLLGVVMGAYSQYSTLGNIISDLSDACRDGASRSVTHQKIKSSQRQMQVQLSALQEQLAGLQSCPDDCPAGWSRHGRKCYFIPPLEATWLQAHRACAVLDRRARLASVHPTSRRHIQALVDISDTERVWIGLSQITEDDWGWSDGSPLDYTDWARFEPNDHPIPSDCVQMSGPRYTGPHGWNDYGCDKPSNFLCQIGQA